MLRRILGYARQRLGLEELFEHNIHDSRKEPRIPGVLVARSALVMMLTRLGSFNALEQTRPSRFWLGQSPPSADTMGRVCGKMDLAGVRTIQHGVYERLKRGKALVPPPHGLMLALLDAHESHATFRRHCSGCLERTIHTKEGDRIQYYHRHVTMSLVGDSLRLLVDARRERMKSRRRRGCSTGWWRPTRGPSTWWAGTGCTPRGRSSTTSAPPASTSWRC